VGESEWRSALVITSPDGTIKDVEPGKSVTLQVGVKINFGKIEGEIGI
jgi:hypothetical protein